MTVKQPFKYHKVAYFCSLALFGATFANADEFEFDERFLGTVAGQPTADVAKYRFGNPIPTGEYTADIFVNGTKHGNTVIKVIEDNDNPLKGLCLTPNLLSVLSLQSDAIKQSASDRDCISIINAIPEAKIQFDVATLALNIEIPQILVKKRPRGYIDPSLWQSGVPALFIRYDANHYIHKFGDRSSKNSYLSLHSGANLGLWSLRHRGSKSWQEQKGLPYQYQYTYLQRDIDAINGRLTLGDLYTSGHFFENFSIRGIQIENDERMLPYSLRGYAPRIQGVVNNPARIIVRQDNHIIYEISVPAGAFSIDDLYPVGYSGKLDVEIIESNGQTRTFSVPFSNAIRLVRAGQLYYRFSGGRYREQTKVFNENIVQAELQYGLANGVTLNLGGMGSKNYLSGLIGAAFDTPLGAFSANVNYTRNKFPYLKQSNKHYGVNVGYSLNLNRWGSYFSASYYKSLSETNYSLSQVLDINRNSKKLEQSHRLKQRVSLSFNQSLGSTFGGISLSAIRNVYWNLNKPVNEYQFSYGNSFKGIQYQLGYSQVKDGNLATQDKQFYANIFFTFGASLNSPTVYATYNKTQQGYTIYTSLNGSLGEDNQFTYAINANKASDSNYYSINSGYKASFAKFNVGMGQSKQTKQTNFAVSGALVAHPEGVTLSNDLSDTFAIISAKGATGAKINNGNAANLDWFGNGIVPYVSPYQTNYIGIDPNNIPADVEIEATGQEIIPRANSISLVKFNTKTGKNILFDVVKTDGTPPPLAAEVFDKQNQLIGYVVQGGRVFVRGIDNSGTLTVIWGNSETERCHFNYQIDPNSDDAIAVQCKTKE
ncbi:fimbria/pilus outer membrane usher protein [Ursidibacter arcticus]